MRPGVLVLDEPTAGLDPKGRDEILDQIAYLHRQSDMTVILVSHSMEDIAKYADRIIVMNKGKILYNDTPKQVFSHYQELEKIGLAAPQVTYIMHDIREAGFDVGVTATTVGGGCGRDHGGCEEKAGECIDDKRHYNRTILSGPEHPAPPGPEGEAGGDAALSDFPVSLQQYSRVSGGHHFSLWPSYACQRYLFLYHEGHEAIIMLLMITVLFNLFLTRGGETLFHAWIFTITEEGLRTAVFMAIRLIYLIAGFIADDLYHDAQRADRRHREPSASP